VIAADVAEARCVMVDALKRLRVHSYYKTAHLPAKEA
jgi:hypothetical protein